MALMMTILISSMQDNHCFVCEAGLLCGLIECNYSSSEKEEKSKNCKTPKPHHPEKQKKNECNFSQISSSAVCVVCVFFSAEIL